MKPTLTDTTKRGFNSTWPGGYRENFEVYAAKTGMGEGPIVRVALEPFYNKEHVALEIGCGGGFWIDKYLAPNFKKVIGLDVIPKPPLVGDNVQYIEVPDRNFECYGVEDGSIDFVWSFGVFCHMTHPAIQSYLHAAFKKLKPGGKAVLYFSNTERRPGTASSGNSENEVLWISNNWVLSENMMVKAGFVNIKDLMPMHIDTIAYAEKPGVVP